MSNIISQFKNRNKRMTKHDAREALRQTNKSGMKSINFHERVMPNTMLVDVKTSTLKIGNATQKMSDIPVTYQIIENPESFNEFLQLLKTYNSETIQKVILDNGDGFKIKTLEEFTADIIKYIDDYNNKSASEYIIDQVEEP